MFRALVTQATAFMAPRKPAYPRRSALIVFGSINVDLVCRAPKIPAPGETILAPSYDFFAGGKGANQAVAAARAGADVRMVGAVGRDAFAEIPCAALRASGVNVECVHTGDAPTGAAFITVAPDGENAITVASGANRLVQATMISEAAWDRASHLVLQGELEWGQSHAVAAEAKRRGKGVILNAAPSQDFRVEILRHVDLLLVNQHELTDIAVSMAIEKKNLQGRARAIRDEAGCAVIVTLGKEGVAFFGPDREMEIPARPVHVVDTTGAGDTFCGVFAAMMAEGCELEMALTRANIAAGLACTKAGAQSAMPLRGEILHAVEVP